MVKQIDRVIVDSAEKAMAGELEFGKHELIGLSEDAVGLADNEVYQNVPEGIRAEIDRISQEVMDGTIEIKSGFAMSAQEITEYKDSVKP